MALSVNSNIQALNAYRNLNKTQSAMSNSLEKLSSGLRINRAADDAAGLAISENLKAQIGGIQQASKNAQDGVSLVQTADGALAQTQTILQRLRTLAVASANGSQSTSSRAAINAEASSLKAELTRISQTSNFNGVNLLDGTLKTAASFQIGYRADNAAASITGNVITVGVDSGSAVSIVNFTSATQAALAGAGSSSGVAGDYNFAQTATKFTTTVSGSTTLTTTNSFDFSTGAGASGAFVLSLSYEGTAYALTVTSNAASVGGLAAALQSAANTTIGANKLTIGAGASGITFAAGSLGATGSTSTLTITSYSVSGSAGANGLYGFSNAAATSGVDAKSFSAVVTLDGVTQTVSVAASVGNSAGLIAALNTAASTAFGGANKVVFAASGTGISVAAGSADSATVGASSTVGIVSLTLGNGNSAAVYGLSVGVASGAASINAFTSKAGAFDANGLGVNSIDLSNQASAQTAISSIDTAITTVSTARASLGALQNRFQYTVDNLDTTAENLSSAQSRILDTDMASEMVSFTRSQILSQAGSAMLAQAKNLPSSLLDLLKG